MRTDPYAEWAPTYPPYAHNALMEVEQAAVLSLLPPVSGRRVLDVGCGTGRYMQLLAALGAQVIGIDRSPAMLARARACAAALAQGDMMALPVAPAACDVVVSGLCLMDVTDLDAVIAEFARVLRLRGVAVYSTLHPSGRDEGWTRTFESPAGRRTMPVCWHAGDDHKRACSGAGLNIEIVEEPPLTPGGQPVAMVIRARRVA
ncbi:MAG TPA: methyltransferase domain-containing protein [Vicinamibacterales bacterium]|nr:methyltransferase domain-containing protein [Vicinamibacterales bacterium]